MALRNFRGNPVADSTSFWCQSTTDWCYFYWGTNFYENFGGQFRISNYDANNSPAICACPCKHV